MVFPRLYTVDDTKIVLVTISIVLKKSQCEGVQREINKTQPGSPVIRRPLDTGARRRFSRSDEVALNRTTILGKTFLGQGDFGDDGEGEAEIINNIEILTTSRFIKGAFDLVYTRTNNR